MEQLEALLRCPACGSEVELDELAVCAGAGHRYPIVEGIPVFLDDQAALRELARVLQPGGRAWVTVPHDLRNISPVFRLANRRHDRRLGHLRRYEAETLIQAARASGLEPVEVQFTGHVVKVLQFAAQRLGDRLWWWCERRDRQRRNVRRGSMQLSVVFARA